MPTGLHRRQSESGSAFSERQRFPFGGKLDNTGLYRDLGYGLVYPQVLDSYRHADSGHVRVLGLDDEMEVIVRRAKLGHGGARHVKS